MSSPKSRPQGEVSVQFHCFIAEVKGESATLLLTKFQNKRTRRETGAREKQKLSRIPFSHCPCRIRVTQHSLTPVHAVNVRGQRQVENIRY